MENEIRVPKQIIGSLLMLLVGGVGSILLFYNPSSEIIRVAGIYIVSTFSAFLGGKLWEKGESKWKMTKEDLQGQ